VGSEMCIRDRETSLQMQRGAWSIWGAYTFANARDRIGQRQVPRDWDQRHTLSASVSWKGAAWTLSALTSHHSGRPNTPFIDDHLASAALGPRNSARLPRYFTIDVRAMRSIELSSGRLVVYGQVSNLLNRGNRCCTEIDLPSEDSDPTRLEIERVPAFPLIPAVGIQWEY
jgi:outer membrane cobalamin receptor